MLWFQRRDRDFLSGLPHIAKILSRGNPLGSGGESVEFGAHISATFISANTTRRRQSQRLFNSAPSNTALTHFGGLHFSEYNFMRHPPKFLMTKHIAY